MAGALLCDEYELTMSQAFWRQGDMGQVAFELFVRSLPAERGYLIAAGLGNALDFLSGFSFTGDELAYLASCGRYDPAFLAYLKDLRFTGTVDAIPEGTPVGAGEPLLRIIAPRIEATLVESALVAIITHQTMIASKTRKIVDAAAGRSVWDFSLRRLHGVGAGVPTARAAWIGGAAGTATVEAGRTLGIPTTGTMAHHFVLSYGMDSEEEAFAAFLREFPSSGVLLVDTYDVRTGVEHAIAASRTTGIPLQGVRIDSGDLVAHSTMARRLLDEAGMGASRIIASSDLDEYRIADLLAEGAPIDGFGVGTMLGTSADAPNLSGVYKLVAQEIDGRWIPLMKCSQDKVTNPGMHEIFRQDAWHDIVGLDGERNPGCAMLQRVMEKGSTCGTVPSLTEIRSRCEAMMEELPQTLRLPHPTAVFGVQLSGRLTDLKEELMAEHVKRRLNTAAGVAS